jgi:hypothetical protein
MSPITGHRSTLPLLRLASEPSGAWTHSMDMCWRRAASTNTSITGPVGVPSGLKYRPSESKPTRNGFGDSRGSPALQSLHQSRNESKTSAAAVHEKIRRGFNLFKASSIEAAPLLNCRIGMRHVCRLRRQSTWNMRVRSPVANLISFSRASLRVLDCVSRIRRFRNQSIRLSVLWPRQPALISRREQSCKLACALPSNCRETSSAGSALSRSSTADGGTDEVHSSQHSCPVSSMQFKLRFSYITNVTENPRDVRMFCPGFVLSSS